MRGVIVVVVAACIALTVLVGRPQEDVRQLGAGTSIVQVVDVLIAQYDRRAGRLSGANKVLTVSVIELLLLLLLLLLKRLELLLVLLMVLLLLWLLLRVVVLR